MRYMRLVASLNLVAVLAMLWSLWAHSVSGGQRGGWQEAAAVAECRVRCMHCPPRDMHLACHPPIVASPQISEAMTYFTAGLAGSWPAISSFVFLDRKLVPLPLLLHMRIGCARR